MTFHNTTPHEAAVDAEETVMYAPLLLLLRFVTCVSR